MPKIKTHFGFTVLELMLVLAIIAIGAAVTGFAVREMMPDLRLSAAARDLKSDLNLARLKAIKENRTVWVVFDKDEDRYDILVDDGDESFTLEDEAPIKTVLMPTGIKMESASFMPGGINRTSFDNRGIAGTHNGTASLINTKGAQRDVAVAKTGRITISKL